MGGEGYSFSMWQMCQMCQMFQSAFCRILRQNTEILSHFSTAFPAQKPYLCTEFHSALTLKGRYSPDGSGLKIHPPVIIGNTLPTNGKNM